MSNPNPPRRCGSSKKANSFYAEGGELSEQGTLYPWTWLLGDGLEKNIFLEIPPRQLQLLNPVLTVLFRTFMPPTGPSVPIPEDKRWQYDHLITAMSVPGIGDHVGTQFYTPYNFSLETVEHGASRRISPQMAKALGVAIAQFGPLPMMFTHKEIPAFRDEQEMTAIKNHITNCIGIGNISWRGYFSQPTWSHDNWGMYARRGQWTGFTHFMIPILMFLDEIKCNWKEHKDDDIWIRAKKFFRGIRFTEQTFGLSWLCKVTYTTPAEGEEPTDEVLEILEGVPGINVLDLDQLDVLEKVIEDANEQVTN